MFYLSLLQRRLLSAGLLSLFTQTSVAENVIPSGITAGQRQQIQAVGQALLTAKRQTKPSQQALLIRQQIKRVKVHLDSLNSPRTTGTLTLKTQAPIAQAKHVDNLQSWRQKQQPHIDRLNAELVTLKQMTEEVQLQQTPAVVVNQQVKPDNFWQQLKSKVLKQPDSTAPQKTEQTVAMQAAVTTDLSLAAIEQLNTLQNEINEAMEQTDHTQRLQKLRVLSKRLTLGRSRTVKGEQNKAPSKSKSNDDSVVVTPTPTITSRTTHRRNF